MTTLTACPNCGDDWSAKDPEAPYYSCPNDGCVWPWPSDSDIGVYRGENTGLSFHTPEPPSDITLHVGGRQVLRLSVDDDGVLDAEYDRERVTEAARLLLDTLREMLP